MEGYSSLASSFYTICDYYLSSEQGLAAEEITFNSIVKSTSIYSIKSTFINLFSIVDLKYPLDDFPFAFNIVFISL